MPEADARLLPVIAAVKKAHTVRRAGGNAYWTHPVHCLERLLGCWPEASLEAQIATLFHDTIEDMPDGEDLILATLAQTALPADAAKILTIVRDVSRPNNLRREAAINAQMRRFIMHEAQPESFLIKAVDILDNTSDLLQVFAEHPDDKGIQKLLSRNTWAKYSGYIRAIEFGWLANYADTPHVFKSSISDALAHAIKAVDKNLMGIMEILRLY